MDSPSPLAMDRPRAREEAKRATSCCSLKLIYVGYSKTRRLLLCEMAISVGGGWPQRLRRARRWLLTTVTAAEDAKARRFRRLGDDDDLASGIGKRPTSCRSRARRRHALGVPIIKRTSDLYLS